MKNKRKRKVPYGWPKNLPFPFCTEEEARKGVEKAEEMIRKELKEIRRKNPPSKHGHEYVGLLATQG